jgi:hypothetical protein
MIQSDKSFIAIALAPNGVFVLGMLGLMAWRLTSGQSPLPHGATPIVMGLSIAAPIGSVCVANFVRLRSRV